ncbi:aminotransferase class I/II-fold pyridoxal phosphate-dependent enzyme [Gracilibacillus kekensis]|uniref:cysteine-S-conjugate beta-lyase n=1 Tax=Gracilibacillus kekensis TaxID=1027249 RepID=A0A1M7QUS6_9BACI|nr:aminotransferase class I/II-fold pyridoxal phosphate-dependent enzyme [Gracilibacillus kekensis]SHN35674.1 cystathionine beta-lyase [Gracilibacillus kekensis]
MTYKKQTTLAHGGHHQGYHEEATGAVNTPIYLSSTFHQKQLNEMGPYDYTRSGNPTRTQLEKTIASLENGTDGFAFSSGMAAISSAFMLLHSNDHIVISKDVYGGTFRCVTQLLSQFSISHTFVDMTDIDEVARAIQSNTRVIYMETPANPLLQITDIRAIVALAKENNCYTYLDNTFMTPLHQQPLDLGVDIVLHSATKFLSGHSDIVAGLAVTKDNRLAEKLSFVQNTYGAVLSVQDCYQLLQGMKTLEPRFNKSTRSAQQIAEHLSNHTSIENIYYPGLASHPGADVHASQSTSPGAVLSFELKKGIDVQQFANHVSLPVIAVSLGAVESILSYPATMSHAAMPVEEREARGISDRLFRLSVGIEDVEDLLNDLENALNQSTAVKL